MSRKKRAKVSLVDANGAVNLSINHSTIIVAAGDVTSSSTDDAAKPQESSTQNLLEEKHVELCNKVNENTLKATTVNITEDVDSDFLSEPDFQVFPQMRRIRDYFMKKNEEEKKTKDTMARKIFPVKIKIKTKKQTEKEATTPGTEADINNENITVTELVEFVTVKKEFLPDDKNTITAIIAPAGSGKTTLLKRMARTNVESRPKLSSEESTDDLRHLKMIHYLEMKDIKHNDLLKPSQLLFGGLYKNEAEEDEAYQWLMDHQSEAMFYLDGLNLATWSASSSDPSKIRPFEKASWTDIMYNILSRNLLPHLNIVISSRGYKEYELPVELRPTDIISLEGYAMEDAEKLFITFVGDKGAEIWENIKTSSPQILNLASSPLFLLLLAVEIMKDPSASPPTTVTELYNKILLSLCHEESIEERQQILDGIKILKSIAHQGMVDRISAFSDLDLKQKGLSVESTRDLMMKASGNKLLCRHLFEGHYVDFFKNQSFQEYLSASHITELGREKFSQLNKKLLHESHWWVVWKFVSGIIHDKATMELNEVSKFKKKQKVFDETIRSRFAKGWNGVEFLAIIYESNDDDWIQSFPYLPSLALTRLTPDEAHMFGAIMARRRSFNKVEIVDLWRCGINDNLIDVIVRNLKGFKVQVDILNLRDNSFTAKGLNSILAHLDADQIWIEYARLDKFRYADLDWNNIRKIDWKCFQMTNGEDVVTFEGEFNGCFHKQEKRISLCYKSSHETVEEPTNLIAFFEPEVMKLAIENEGEPQQFAEIKNPKPQRKRADSQISWNFIKYVTSLTSDPESGEIRSEEQVYANLRHFVEMSKHNIDIEIKMVLLDCRSEENVDSSSIELSIRKFKVRFLDILMDDKTSFDSSGFLTEFESRNDINVRVHWWFKVTGIDDVTNLIPLVQQHQVENLRLHFVKGISFGLATDVITSCKLTKLTLVHENDEKSHKKKLHKMSKLADRNSIELEPLLYKYGNSAWQVADSHHTKKLPSTISEEDKSSED